MRRVTTGAILVSFLVIMMWAGAAAAFETGIYEQGFVVPYATYDASGVGTVVGIDLSGPPAPTTSAIYWSFMSINGVQLSFGSIPITSGVFTFPFALSTADNGVHTGVEGWLIFTWDDNGTLDPGESTQIVGGNAFLLDLANNDAAFIPIIPLARGDYQAGPINLNSVPADVLTGMSHGVNPANTEMSVRFTNDTSIAGQTVLYVFTPLNAPATFTAFADGDSGLQTSNFNLARAGTQLNFFNLSAVPELSGIVNGSLTLVNPASSPIGFTFGLSSSSVLGASQTTVVNAFE